MLHHGHVAVVGLFVHFGLAFGDVFKVNLVVLVGLGVDGRAGEGGVELGLAFGLVAVAHQLHVQLRLHSSGAAVDDFIFHANGVTAALERVGLDQLDAADHIGLEANGQAVLAICHPAFATKAHDTLVVREVAANQAGLGHVLTLCAVIEQHQRLLVVIQQFDERGLNDRAALGIKAHVEQIGAHLDQLTFCGGCAGVAWQLRCACSSAGGRNGAISLRS